MIAGLVIFAVVGGWLSRMCGGAPPKLPYGLDQWFYALPYLLAGVPAGLAIATVLGVKKENRKYFTTLALLPYTAAFLGKRTGHGGGIDLGTSGKVREDEKLEFIVKPLHGKIPEYWYDVLLLSVTGLAVTILGGTGIMCIDPEAGIVVALSGLLKGPAYMIGRAIYPRGSGRGIPHLNEATAIGEFLTGFFGWGAIGWAICRLCSTYAGGFS